MRRAGSVRRLRPAAGEAIGRYGRVPTGGIPSGNASPGEGTVANVASPPPTDGGGVESSRTSAIALAQRPTLP